MKKVKLDEIRKIETPFRVPEGYFDSLEHQIQERVSNRQPSVTVPVIRWSLIPALLVIIISGVLVVNNLQPDPVDEQSLLADLTNEEILTYLVYTDISESEIVTLADQEVLIPEDTDYLNNIELGEKDLDELIDQLGIESEYL